MNGRYLILSFLLFVALMVFGCASGGHFYSDHYWSPEQIDQFQRQQTETENMLKKFNKGPPKGWENH